MISFAENGKRLGFDLKPDIRGKSARRYGTITGKKADLRPQLEEKVVICWINRYISGRDEYDHRQQIESEAKTFIEMGPETKYGPA